MTRTILFLCPHHAAKSVLASAYFDLLKGDLDFRAESGGTDPDTQVNPAVANLLKSEGIDVSAHQPRHVTQAQLATAYRIISMGCTAEALQMPSEKIEMWSDVPMVSQDLLGAREAIYRHVTGLIAALNTESQR